MTAIPRPRPPLRPSTTDSSHIRSIDLPVTPHHRSLVAVDIEGSTTRTNVARARFRHAMYGLVEEAMLTAGIDEACRDELLDRGDGVLAIVHPVDEVPKTVLLNTMIPALSTLLAQYNNRDHTQPKALRMRAVVHAGEVHYDQRGCFGEAVDLSFRLLESPELKRRFAHSDAPLVLVVSDEIYCSVVRHGYEGIDQQGFEPLVQVQMAGRLHRGWVSFPDTTGPDQGTCQVTDLHSRRDRA